MITAVEWLIENCHIVPKNQFNKRELIEQAKEMFEQQIIDTYKEGCFDNILDEKTDKVRAEQYYNETFKK